MHPGRAVSWGVVEVVSALTVAKTESDAKLLAWDEHVAEMAATGNAKADAVTAAEEELSKRGTELGDAKTRHATARSEQKTAAKASAAAAKVKGAALEAVSNFGTELKRCEETRSIFTELLRKGEPEPVLEMITEDSAPADTEGPGAASEDIAMAETGAEAAVEKEGIAAESSEKTVPGLPEALESVAAEHILREPVEKVEKAQSSEAAKKELEMEAAVEKTVQKSDGVMSETDKENGAAQRSAGLVASGGIGLGE